MVEVVAALIFDGDRFLICQRPAHKARGLLWEFVGGKVEPGETKQAALIRECREFYLCLCEDWEGHTRHAAYSRVPAIHQKASIITVGN